MLQLVSPSPQVLATYRESLRDFGIPASNEIVLYHLPVGSLASTDVLNGATLQEVEPSGCRFVSSFSDGAHISCEMTNPSLYGNAKFRNFTSGDGVAALLRRIQEAANLAPVQIADYMLHFLSAPDFFFEGLHLVCERPESDLVLPTASAYPDLPETAVLNASEFLRTAAAIARTRLSFSASDLSS